MARTTALRDAVHHALSSASDQLGEEVQLVNVVDASNGETISDWDSTRVGDGNIRITISAPASVESMVHSLQQASLVHTARACRNVVAQILVAIGAAQLGPVREKTYVPQSDNRRVRDLFAHLCFGDPALRERMDTCHQRPHGDGHLAPLSALDEEVEELVGLVSPSLQAKCPWECRVLNAYPEIKARFPERFV